jgi:uncharacterized membrane protein
MIDFVETWTRYLAAGVEFGAGLIVGMAAIQAVIRSISIILRPTDEQDKEDIRLSFARWLALALEFEVASDILRTTIAPTWNEIGQLAAIVALRTLLNFFLQREIAASDARKSQAPPAT